LKVLQIAVGEMANFTYILVDEGAAKVAIIDPSWNLTDIIETLKKNSWKADYVINTHTHFDHVLGNEEIAAITGAKIVQHKDSTSNRDLAVSDGDTIGLGKIRLIILHTPGHSADSMCIIADDKVIFTGDTLFVGSCGRVDLPGSNPNAMYDSLYRKIPKLNDSLVVYPGHDYGSRRTSTIGEEKNTNYILKQKTKQDFLSMIQSG
jgi:hydroxyacylglutathione hydrolase